MEVEQLLRRELRAKLPLAQQVLLYLDPFAFFKDASRGTAMVRERNLSYNRGMRWVLVPYLRRWLLIAAGLFLAIAPAEGMAAQASLVLVPAALAVGFCLAAAGSWQGATCDDMVMRWGPPNRSATLSDGRQTHTWTSQEGPVRAGGPSVGVGVFGGGGGGGVAVAVAIPSGTTFTPPICERTVTFQENKVVDQNWTGDPGYCRYFKRA